MHDIYWYGNLLKMNCFLQFLKSTWKSVVNASGMKLCLCITWYNISCVSTAGFISPFKTCWIKIIILMINKITKKFKYTKCESTNFYICTELPWPPTTMCVNKESKDDVTLQKKHINQQVVHTYLLRNEIWTVSSSRWPHWPWISGKPVSHEIMA